MAVLKLKKDLLHCEYCGTHNPNVNAFQCKACGVNFEPEWMRERITEHLRSTRFIPDVTSEFRKAAWDARLEIIACKKRLAGMA